MSRASQERWWRVRITAVHVRVDRIDDNDGFRKRDKSDKEISIDVEAPNCLEAEKEGKRVFQKQHAGSWHKYSEYRVHIKEIK